MNVKDIIHIRCDGAVLCGANSTRTVPPSEAKYVTCKRCLASLGTVGK